jgi:signal transduction histidine kinase
MYNLVENSVRHGKELTTIKLSSFEEAGDMIILYEDDGGGIIEEEKEKVFGKGFGKNTGLGLFLIREILSITGISIAETGVPGIGVRFEIRVPSGKYRYTH